MSDWLVKTQALSGSVFSTFSLGHLVGHALANYRFELANKALYAFREFYQYSPLMELGLLGGSLLIHVTSSLLIKRSREARQQLAAKKKNDDYTESIGGSTDVYLHRQAGFLLGLSIVGHVTAVRVAPLFLFQDASLIDLTYVTRTAQKFSYVFIPYYCLFVSAAFYHSVYGVAKTLKVFRLPHPKISSTGWLYIAGMLAVVGTSTVLAISGIYEDVFIPLAPQWDELHHKLFSLFSIL